MALQIVVLLAFYLLLNPAATSGQKEDNDIDQQLCQVQTDLATYWKLPNYNEIPPSNFKNMLSNLSVFDNTGKLLADITLCGICKKLILNLQLKLIAPKKFGEYICTMYIQLRTWTNTTFCQDLIRLNLPILEYIVDHSDILTPRYACSVILQNRKCYEASQQLTWKIHITPDAVKQTPQVTRNLKAKPLKILHLTDLHISTDYEIGGVSNCGFPICCKQGIGSRINKETAGKWGNYDCDIPFWLFSYTLQHINRTHTDLDLIYFTGDVMDHMVWKASQTNNSELLYFVFKALYESFPNTPILPTLGNHEPVPLNVYAPRDPDIEKAGFSTQWLYDLLSKLWRSWLPVEAQKTVKKQGYYAYTLNKKFKVISLNNNICYNLNWWLLLDTTFLEEQLIFLRKELEEAEQNHQFVHIITHIPVGNKECVEPWEENYGQLIKRFAHIIKGQFFGHTHTDELKIFYNEDNSEAINVGYNGGSLTPYQKYNPNYKILYVDPNTYEILDVETYIFNLTYANEHPEQSPAYYKLYSIRKAYNLTNLQPSSFKKLVDKMFNDEKISDIYWRNYVRQGDPSIKEGCNAQCKRKLMCDIVTTYSMKPDSSPRRECT